MVATDLENMSRLAAEFVAKYVIHLAKAKGRVSIVLCGGETPRGLYQRLAGDDYGAGIPWRQVHLFWGDERWVSQQHRESNYRLAYETLISRISIPPENVNPMVREMTDPQKSANEYEKKLREFFGLPRGGWPRFDLVILGVGIDGHTASLFPGGAVLKEKKRWVAALFVQKIRAYRLTLTLPVFNHAAQVIFLVAGREKASVIREGLGADHPQVRFPFQLIKPRRGQTIFFLDAAAASLMDQSKETK